MRAITRPRRLRVWEHHRVALLDISMSTTQTTETEYECSNDSCNTYFTQRTSIRGSYCSESCYYEERGEDALANLTNDHRICNSCCRRVKETTHPGEEWVLDKSDPERRALENGATYTTNTNGGMVLDATDVDQSEYAELDNLIGYQDTTEHARRVVDVDPERNLMYTRIGCECGAVNPQDDPHEVIRESDWKAYFVNLLDRLEEKEAEGRLSERVDRSRFLACVRDGMSIEEAVGRALYED